MVSKIKLNDIEADVTRKSIKNMYMRFCHLEGKILISAPNKISTEEIKRFAFSKLNWIKNQQKNINKKTRIKPYKYINDESHYFRGKSYTLIIVNNKSPFVELTDKHILLNIPQDSIVEERKSVMEKWYQKQLLILIPPLIKKWENTLNVSVDSFFIRKMKTRWGSCTPKSRRIRFNIELAKASPEILEYIVVHELIHLIEASHNIKFRALMDYFYPNWKYFKKELNNINFRT